MRRSTVIVEATLLAVLMALLLSPSPISGSSVGVKVGMWWMFGQISASGPPYENVTWMKNLIQSVNGFNITLQEILHYQNGTENTQTVSGNIETGEGELQTFIILAGLNKNDPVYQGGSSGYINDTLTQSYSIGSRTVDFQNITFSGFGYTQSTVSYWDRATGILLETIFDYASFFGSGSQYHLTVTQSSTLQLTLPGGTNLLGILLSTAPFCAFLRRRRAVHPPVSL